jgi:Tol biopolymer transport system component
VLVLAVFFLPVAGLLVHAEGRSDGPQAGESAEYDESVLLNRVRQLTYEGRRAGEGYFSPDGSKMVFQSEREEGNPWFQIYLMDMMTGETRRISPGQGKTTCSFINPVTGDIEFASTHHDPETLEKQRAELEFRASGQEHRYAWDYDPEMEIYVADAETGELTRLTDVWGYDAEGSYSPDGEWIVFSSTRDAYNRELSEGEQRALEVDPSYFAEIYIMRADGSEQTRLTDVPGYDGGPFFSPDGKKIVWRQFDEGGLIADVWTMDTDGSNKHQVTDFGAMSWAPYTHPSGEYIFFSSNKYGFANFEIFIVDFEGNKEPVRVTTTEGFDGLPVPTPDGKQLVWTSNRYGAEERTTGQLFIADWNHEKALELLAQSPPRTSNSEVQ